MGQQVFVKLRNFNESEGLKVGGAIRKDLGAGGCNCRISSKNENGAGIPRVELWVSANNLHETESLAPRLQDIFPEAEVLVRVYHRFYPARKKR